MTIKAVFFDMGGTIDKFWYSKEMRLAETPGLQLLLSSYGIELHLTDHQLYDLVTNGIAHYHQWRLSSYQELSASVVWRDYILAGKSDPYPQLDSIADDLMVWIETHYYKRTMRPEIPAVLAAIQSMGLKIGLISNVNSRGQVPLNLTQYGIKHYFNPIVLSSEYKWRKPDPSIFHYAARLANCPTSECIYIGDRIARDIVGAKRAGYKLAIQIKHDFRHGESDDGAVPDLILNNMTELLDVLRSEIQTVQESRKQTSTDHKIRAVLFDADGILYYRNNKDKEFNAFITEVSKCNEFDHPELPVLRHKVSIGDINFEQYRTAILNLYGITQHELVNRGIKISLEEKDKILFFGDTLETLKTLKNRNLYLGIITDTSQPLNVKINKLERGGFGHLWDSIIASYEVGVQKPDPKIFQLALQQLGLTPDEAIFVGHKSSELDGASSIGIRTVAFNYDPEAKADIYIDKFAELADLPILN